MGFESYRVPWASASLPEQGATTYEYGIGEIQLSKFYLKSRLIARELRTGVVWRDLKL